jgi:SAM-dependent methyltransferase
MLLSGIMGRDLFSGAHSVGTITSSLVPLPSRSMTYDRADYWTDVAQRIGARDDGGWDLAGDTGPFHRYQRDVIVQRMIRQLPVHGRSVLELGCGPGGNLLEISKLGPDRLVGCDIAPGMIELARRNTSGIDVELTQVSGDDLPFAEREFDTVFTLTVLQHNPDDVAPALIEGLARVTGSTLQLMEAVTSWRTISAGDTNFIRRIDDYVRWVTANGFRLADVTQADVWVSHKAWLVVHRLASLIGRGHAEGQRVSGLEHAIERAALRLSRPLDARLPQLSGLVAMRFERLPSSNVR